MVTSTLYAFQSAAWRNITDPHVNVAGWRRVMKAYVFTSGAWRIVYNRDFIFSPTIAADDNDYVLTTRAGLAGWNGVDPLIATITINAGVYVGSSSIATAAMTIGNLPAGSSVTIINNGLIVGRGGVGGAGGSGTTGLPAPGQAAGAGGLALSVSYATSITNNGTVGGGGGGGGGGSTRSSGDEGGSGGGGGRGLTGGAGGALGTGSITPGSVGGAGSKTTRGTSVYGPGFGYGGDLGAAGDTGNPDDLPGGTAGAAGACTSGNANISWTVVGTRLGALN